jgi:cytochrome P450
MTNSTITIGDIDLSDPDAFVDGVPHAAFERLRREDPVHFNPEPDGPGFWAVTRYADINTVHKDPGRFSSELGGTSLEDLTPEQIEARKSMIDMDPPQHDRLRAIIKRQFTHRAVGGWEAQIRRVTAGVLERALALDEFDFVEHVAAEIPMRVFGEIMGIPAADRRHIVKIGNQLVGLQDPEYAIAPDAQDPMLPCSSPIAREMFAVGRRLADLRRNDPRGDVVSRLVAEGLDQREYDVYFLLLAVGGNETTRNTITHGAIALLDNPAQLERLRRNPELIGPAVEEMLRWSTPVHHFRRTATRDTELGGRKIAAGDKVTTWFVSGNRDGDVFAVPDRFDIERAPNRHMTFGPGGVHHCLGAHLARLELRIFFLQLLAQPARLELIGPPQRLRSNFFNGVKRLPARWR